MTIALQRNPEVDTIGEYCGRLTVAEIREANEAFNCNLFASDDEASEAYFNSDHLPDHVRIIDEAEAFDRYVD